MIKKLVSKIHKYSLLLFRGREFYAKKIGVKIGKGCRIYIDEWGTEPFLIEIGNKVTITAGVSLITHDGSTWLFNDEKGRRYLYQNIVIGNNVFVGLNSTIMPGVKIGDNVIIAAGSIVTKSIPKNSIVGGNPAKIIGDFESYKKRVLEKYPSKMDMDKIDSNYKDRILSVLNNTFKKEMSK